jgi:outer membrane protein assembly factor BamB
VPVRIVLTASDTITVTGGTLLFQGAALDSAGEPVGTSPVAWKVSDTLKGQVTGGGVFTAGPEPGLVYVRGTVAATPPLADSIALRVVPPGTVKWAWAAAAVGGTLPILGGPALATDGTVYVLVETGGFPDFPGIIVALSPTGTMLWSRPLLQVAGSTGPVVTPSTGRILVVGKNLYLLGSDGTPLWDTVAAPEVGPVFLSGAATSDLLVAAWGKQVAVFRASDHVLSWASQVAPNISWLVPATITADGARVLAKRTADTLFVFQAADGQVLSFFPDPDTAVDKRVFVVGTVPVRNRYYLPTRKRLAAYDTAGPLLWLTGDNGAAMTEPAVGVDGTLYVQNRLWGLQALNPDGSTRWYRRTFLPPSGPWAEEPFAPSGPALAQGGIIYAAGFGALFAYDTAGALLWKHVADSADTHQPLLGAPAIAPDGTVYSFTSTHVYAFWASAPPEPNSPWPMWRHDAGRTGWAR